MCAGRRLGEGVEWKGGKAQVGSVTALMAFLVSWYGVSIFWFELGGVAASLCMRIGFFQAYHVDLSHSYCPASKGSF